MRCRSSFRISRGAILHRLAIPSLLGLASCIPLPKMVLANELPNAQLTQTPADTQIASLITKIDRALANDGIPSDEVIEMLFSVLTLGPTSSTAGRRVMAEFHALLVKRAADERASGHLEKAVYLSAFAEVIEPAAQTGSKQADIGIEGHVSPTGRLSAQDNAAENQQTKASKQADVPMDATSNTNKANGSKVHAQPPDNIATALLPAASPAIPSAEQPERAAGLSVKGPTPTTVIASATPHGVAQDPETTSKRPNIAPSSTVLPSIQQTALSRGDLMLSFGDIIAARLLFAHAASSGNGVAALKLGDTYNPAVLAELRLQGIKADPAEAEAWYRKAHALGEAQAETRLKKLADYRSAVSTTR